jgi:hypothetical protein
MRNLFDELVSATPGKKAATHNTTLEVYTNDTCSGKPYATLPELSEQKAHMLINRYTALGYTVMLYGPDEHVKIWQPTRGQ